MQVMTIDQVITIDRGGEFSLRGLWLPAEKIESDATAYMEKAQRKAYGKPEYEPLLVAFCSVRIQWEKTVECIRERGGLLHIGAVG